MFLAAATDGAVAAASSAGLPQPIHTRQTLFAIPFRVDPSARSARDPVQVLLYVSSNRGATWELTSQAEPEKNQFLFRAGSDGEFWFIIRTALQGVQPQAPAAERPGLRVIVDTQSPKLELIAERGGGGQLAVRWKITEAHLKADSLKIQYRVGPDQPWQTVAIDRSSDAIDGLEHAGEATWWQPGELQRVEIRGEVADLAGNTAVSHAQIGASLGTVPRPRPAPDVPPPSSPSALPRGAGQPQLNAPEGSLKGRLPSSAWRPVRHSRARAELDGTAPSAAEDSSNGSPSGGPSGLYKTERQTAARSGQGPAAAPIQFPFAGQVGSPRAFTQPNLPGGDSAAPRFRIVNARTFALDYDVGSTRPASDEQVEFWGTRDGGRTWLSYGTDPDQRSPMVLTVNEEGAYGFRIGVRRGGGGSEAPPSGAVPDLWVVVRCGTPSTGNTPAGSARIVDAQPVPPARPGQPAGL
jgi:hypothetical protein